MQDINNKMEDKSLYSKNNNERIHLRNLSLSKVPLNMQSIFIILQ
jgi:hypothetical protein